MKIGIKAEENLKILLEEVLPYDYVSLDDENLNLSNINIIIIDSEIENLENYLLDYKRNNINVIALVGEKDIHKMRELFLSKLVDDCIIRKEIFRIEESIERLSKEKGQLTGFYLSDTFKKGIYKFSDINYITYSGISRKTEFHLTNSETFTVKKNFYEIEEKIKNLTFFYKLDRSTIINIQLIEILDFKEETIIFKNKDFIYTSKQKLKEIESKNFFGKNMGYLEI
ncbi:LytTR family DNA-binding domain-containing protein [Fusobacterium perfoetens]|uniref:LytTR family DNA-binding domain-containing protein n=1 Tax=Fusobacterium perfoetens TaxID=852 RepID=UPI0004840159|nr:LytTR family DNA-binding domain-containing protein [Fusobacterium perfoetens]MCI6152839.1 LytTR family transcriptional regulator [Fusobacterium perfoetens]MDY3237249.1 LytTR family DNA-binding domain-containing protein [Fusobacterium perfoetens]